MTAERALDKRGAGLEKSQQGRERAEAADAPPAGPREAPLLDERDDPRIDLQAIAWAPEAGDSFAVINGQIVREGGSLEGITVIRIDQDSVSFQEGTNKWQQNFKIR
jgi:hypothetical protein